MNKSEFEKKYKTEIALMSREKDVDMGVAADMLIAHVKNRNVDTPYKYDFEGAENLNYEEMEKEIKEMEDRAAELRQNLL